MIKSGIIQRFTVELDCTMAGFPACKWVGISVEPGKIDDVAEKIAQYHEVRLVATTDGDHDIVLEIIGPDERDRKVHQSEDKIIGRCQIWHWYDT
jgi:DNA-binding Lrp family transcriptional regulator